MKAIPGFFFKVHDFCNRTERLHGFISRHKTSSGKEAQCSYSPWYRGEHYFPSSLPSAPRRLPEKGPKPWLLLPFLVDVWYYKPGWVSTDPESKELHNMLLTLSHQSLPLCCYLVSFVHIHACASTCGSQRTTSDITIIVCAHPCVCKHMWKSEDNLDHHHHYLLRLDLAVAQSPLFRVGWGTVPGILLSLPNQHW